MSSAVALTARLTVASVAFLHWETAVVASAALPGCQLCSGPVLFPSDLLRCNSGRVESRGAFDERVGTLVVPVGKWAAESY